jgi:hypothetical protein
MCSEYRLASGIKQESLTNGKENNRNDRNGRRKMKAEKTGVCEMCASVRELM